MTNLDAKDVLAGLTESGVQAVYRSLGVESFQANGPSNWITRSPLRPDDHKPSFSIRREDGLWHDKATDEGGSIYDATMCVRSCDFPTAIEHVANTAGIAPALPQPATPAPPRRISACRSYVDEHGETLLQSIRYEPKSFSQRRPDGKGGWIYNLQGVRLVLYRLPEILAADAGRKIIIVEGEKDADRLAELGLIATTNPMGAGKWRDEYNASLQGRDVVILPDNDTAGAEHAQKVAASLHGAAASVRVVNLPDLPEKGDVSDWLDSGGTLGALRHLVELAPEWQPDTTVQPASPGLVLTSLADVVATPTDWMWPRRLARRKVHIMAGHPGDGKSTVATAKAAILSVGGIWPDGAPAPLGRSLFLLAEDGLEDTLKPRLDMHGADSSMVFALKAVREMNGNEAPFNMARHLPLLEQAIAEKGIDYLVIDPLTSFLPNSDRNAEGDVRDLLTPLSALADRTGVAVEAIMHVGKPSGTNRRPLQQILGATAFGAIARVVTMIAPVSDDPADTRRVMAVVKSNLAIKPPALEFFRGEDEPITWVGESDLNIDELLAGVKSQPRVDAEGFLRDTLAEGPVSSIDIKLRASAEKISWATLRRAAEEISVEKFKQEGVFNGPWYWRLPAHELSNLPSGHDREQLRQIDPHTKLLTPLDAHVSNFATSEYDSLLHHEDAHISGKMLTEHTTEHLPSPPEDDEVAHSEYREVSNFDSIIRELEAWQVSGHLALVEDPIVISSAEKIHPDGLSRYLKVTLAALAIASKSERAGIGRELEVVHREIHRQLMEQEAA